MFRMNLFPSSSFSDYIMLLIFPSNASLLDIFSIYFRYLNPSQLCGKFFSRLPKVLTVVLPSPSIVSCGDFNLLYSFGIVHRQYALSSYKKSLTRILGFILFNLSVGCIFSLQILHRMSQLLCCD